MGYYTYCHSCKEGLGRPNIQELQQGYIKCWNCGTHWEDIDQINALFELIENLQSQINELKKGKINMPKQELNFENDMKIDLDNLHEEWQFHAQTRYKYAEEVAYLDKVVKQQNKIIEVKKTELKEITSRLILQIKEANPKFTVQQIDATIQGNKELKSPAKELSDEQDKLIQFEYDLNMAKNALKAFDDRKIALENEVILWTRNYFATPREERQVEAGKKIADMGRSQTEKKQRGALKRTRKKE